MQVNTTTLVYEDAVKRVLVPTDDTVDNIWKGGIPFDDSGWNDGTFITDKTGGVGYEANTGYEPYISYDVTAKMYNGNNSCYIRIPFYFDGDPGEFNFMTLNIRYDDGFIAYLNGDELERINFPVDGTPSWNSYATGGHEAGGLETIPVSDDINSLQQGDNILAVSYTHLTLPTTPYV